MRGSGDLSPRQNRALAALIQTSSIEEAANQACLAPSSLHRYLKDPCFQKAYRGACREMVQHTVAQVQRRSLDALEVLYNVMRDENIPSSSRVHAARVLLSHALGLPASSRHVVGEQLFEESGKKAYDNRILTEALEDLESEMGNSLPKR